MANKVKFGLKNVHYAVATDDGNGGLTYGTPVAIPGAVNLQLDPQGDMNPFFADNILYFQSIGNNGYSGTLEVARIPESFLEDVLGETADTNGVLVESVGEPTVEFALLFQFEGDKNAIRHCMYRCVAQRGAVNGQTTEENIEPQTETLNITAMPRISDNLVKSRCDETASPTQYAAWFDAIYEPTI